MLLKIKNYELSAYNGKVVELDRWNSPFPSRRTVRIRYYNSGRVVEYSYRELERTGAMITSILDSTSKRISFAQLWKDNGDWDWVLIVENLKYRIVYGCSEPLTLDRMKLESSRWYRVLKAFLGEQATIGLLAYELDELIGAERIREENSSGDVLVEHVSST